ncbi:MAG TPA: radical SAM protein [Anaerolineales bacterium]|nr:radical SAM protein [Anaerolineae bacterium]HIQ00982.1 radical SAM protein [Anaerolineales bacterium]
MSLTGLHLLLTYQCNYECDHCFAWGSPSQEGTMTLAQVRDITRQAQELGTVEWIYLEGGEPFLYYPIMVRAAQEAAALGFHVGIVTNDYWATAVEDAVEWLRPFVGIVDDLTLSTDLFHYDEVMSAQARNALAAAEQRVSPRDAG